MATASSIVRVSVGIDSDGNIYVADWGNQRVQVLDSEGNFLVKLKGEATLGKWATEYLDSQQDEFRAAIDLRAIFRGRHRRQERDCGTDRALFLGSL